MRTGSINMHRSCARVAHTMRTGVGLVARGAADVNAHADAAVSERQYLI